MGTQELIVWFSSVLRTVWLLTMLMLALQSVCINKATFKHEPPEDGVILRYLVMDYIPFSPGMAVTSLLLQKSEDPGRLS